ncbi:sialic acid-binding Ig-like lectin 11 isoform X1 [Dipodomys spectabilis]|uniref:sialic acid-binding Ig-like lectin 11 isoform X1 n=1 Tax=Dipodomys spectabilis TaxID=105255 RepID=UPI001C53802C|nr:sialic acid-binding Ig-like lectin 11 isoform X1 [Dipodomys spectabilis]
MQQLLLLLLLLRAGGQADRPGHQVEPRGGIQLKVPQHQLKVQESVTVQEGLCTLVSCSVHYSQVGWNYSVPAYGYWYRRKKSSGFSADPSALVATNNPDRRMATITQTTAFHLIGDPGANDCSLRISGAQMGDSGRYYFRLERGDEKFTYKNPLLMVTVTALTQIPDINIKEPLEAGRLSHLRCSMPGTCEGALAPNISWHGLALKAHSSQNITVIPRPQDHGSNITCRVILPSTGVSRERTVQLSVFYAPQTVTISSSGGGDTESQGNTTCMDVRKGQFLRLLCTAAGQPPPTLTWVLGNRVLSRSNVTDPGTLGLDLPEVEVRDAGRYTCHAENRLGSQHRALDLSVQYPPEALTVTASQGNSTELEIHRNGSSLHVLQGQSLRLVCVTHSYPSATLSWARGSQTLSPTWPAEPGVLELPVVEAEHEGEFTCRAQNPLGALHISLSLSVHWKATATRMFTLGTVCGAGGAAMLFLCATLVFCRMKTRRTEATSPPATVTVACSTPRTTWKSHMKESRLAFPPPAVARPTKEEEELDIHYASLSFSRLKPAEAWDSSASTNTEYAEIKIHK